MSARSRIGIGLGMCAMVSMLGVQTASADADSTWKDLGFKISGAVEASYTQNFNNPNTNVNQLRIFDTQANSFVPQVAQIVFERAAIAGSATDRVGFRARLNFGAQSRFSRARTNFQPGTDNNELDFQELYGEYIAPIGNGLLIQAGKINTALGYETFTSWENPNFSRTFNYNLAQAFTTTGVRFTYEFNPMVKVMTAVSNGWDNIEDNNKGKIVEGALTLTNFGGRLTNYFYVSHGPEQPNGRGGAIGCPLGVTGGGQGCDGTARRFVLDYILTGKLTDMDTLIVEAHYGNETRAGLDPAKIAAGEIHQNARWNAVVAYLNHDFNDQWALNTRAELFEDAGGARTCSGAVTFNAGNNTCAPGMAGTGRPQTLQSYTFTIQYKPAPALITRTEIRHDISDKDSFLRGSRAVDNQTTLAVNVVYLF